LKASNCHARQARMAGSFRYHDEALRQIAG
jgi:hypothetical protein